MLLGIDIGTTALKAAVFDRRSGLVLAKAGCRLTTRTDADGAREQDPQALLDALASAVAELRAATGTRWGRIEGIGLATQGGSSLLVEGESGAPFSTLFLWNDTRAGAHFDAIAAARPARWWRTRTLRDEPGMGLARVEWLRGRQADPFTENTLLIGAGEFVFHRLTGQWRQDACHALQSGCYDTRTDSMVGGLLPGHGLPAAAYAPMRCGHETQPLGSHGAALLQLPAGIPVAGPYNDHEAGFLSVQAVSRQPLQASLGTAWVGNFILPETLRGHAPYQFSIPSPCRPGRQVIMPLLTGNVTWDWALATFLHPEHERALEASAEVFARRILPPPGVVALPWLNRPNPLLPNHTGAACLCGLGPATRPDDLLRAVATGMVLEFSRVFSGLLQAGAVDALVLGGGAMNGRQFRALFAAAAGSLPTLRITETDLMGTRGCLHAFDSKASSAAIEPLPPAAPDLAAGFLDARAAYERFFACLYGGVSAGNPYAITRS